MKIPLYASCGITREAAAQVLDFAVREKVGDPFSARRELEAEICLRLGVTAAKVTYNTASALRALLCSWSICRGEAVFVPSFAPTFVIFSVLESGAVPVFVDCDSDTWCMSAAKLEGTVKKCIKSNELYPRAVIVSDVFGMPFDYSAINSVCIKYGLILIEDASAAFGAEWNEKKAGSLGDASVIGLARPFDIGVSGSVGAALANDDRAAANIRIAVEGGQKVFSGTTGASEAVCRGEASVIDELTAGLIALKLADMEKNIAKRRQTAERLKTAAEGTAVKYQKAENGVYGAYPVFPLCAEDKESAERMIKGFRELETECEAVFSKPLCRHAAFKSLGASASDLPVGSSLSVGSFVLPCHEELTEKQIEHICEAIKRICV